MSPRKYDNSRRAAQAERTRLRILDATIDLLGGGNSTLTLAEIADAADVSVATVTKYYPNREAIFVAVQGRLDDRLGRPRSPKTLADLRAAIVPLHRYFVENEEMVRVVLRSPPLRPLWEAVHARRDEPTRQVLAELTAHLSAGDATAVRATILRILGAEGWLDLRDRWQVPYDSITRVAQWAVGTLLDQLARDKRASRRRARKKEESDDS